LEFGIVKVQDGIEEFVPMPYGVKQANGQQDRPGKGQNKIPEQLKFIGSIEARRLFEFFGQALEKTLHHECFVNVDATGENEGPVSVDQVEFSNHQISGNQAGVEQERYHYKNDEEPAPRQIPVGKRVRERHGEQHVDDRAAYCDNHAVRGCPQERWVAEELIVRFKRPI
jgi:hypothetical protein